MHGERGNVFAAFAQRWHVDLDGIQPEQQVFAKLTGSAGRPKIGIGGGDHAHVYAHGAGRSHALDFARFQHPQQLGLLAKGHISDFIEEDSAAVGQFKASNAVEARVGEGAFHVSEEFTFKKRFGHGASIHGDHEARRPRRECVQRPRYNFFSGAVLARDQNIRVGRANAGNGLEHRLHGRRGGDELGASLGLQQPILRRQSLGALQRAAQFNLRPQNREQPLVLPGLLDEVPRAAAHGLHGQFDVGPGGHDDDGNGAVESQQSRKEGRGLPVRKWCPACNSSR